MIAALLFTSIPVATAAEDKIVLYVSPQGNDSASGAVNTPLKTMEGARKKLQTLQKGKETAVEVVFREGVYRFDSTVNFGAEDSGTKEAPIVYKAYDGENVIFKGSVPLDLSKLKRVTDTNVLRRIHPNATGKVLELDLAEQGLSKQEIFDASQEINLYKNIESGEPNSLFINDKELTLAHWPNGRNYARWDKNINDYTFSYKEDDPNRWGEAKNWWVRGYFDQDYRGYRVSATGVDNANKTISILENTGSRVVSERSKRWQGWNLLEELDIPGEYYIDRDAMKLYFYPPYTLKDATAELSVLATPMINILEAHDITFSGIHFTQTRYHAFKMKDVDNVDVIGCRFTYIACTAVHNCGEYWEKGYRGAETQKNFWQRTVLDNSYNCDVRDCVFYQLGGAAVRMAGGNVDTLTPSNNVVENNLILRVSQKYDLQGEPIEFWGCGCTIRNNEIAGLPWQAVHMFGNDVMIEYNEIYDVMQEASDAGAIYSGANEVQRGNQINYNYFHDFQVTTKLEHDWQNAIYWDGATHGGSSEHNFIYNVPTDFLSNGSSATKHRYNVSVDTTGETFRWWAGSSTAEPEAITPDTMVQTGEGTVQNVIDSIYDKELYFKHYPDLKKWYEGTPGIKLHEVEENLHVNPAKMSNADGVKKWAQVWENNQVLDETDAFVDPEHQDFRLKKDSELAKQMPHLLTEDFDLDQIGLQQKVEYNETTSPFRLLYPANGQYNVSNLNTQFAWEDAFGGMHYRLVIAKDPELKEVVYDKTSEFNVVTVDGLEPNMRYYWKAYAINHGRKTANEWASEGAVYSFKTSMYDSLDTLAGETALLNAESLLATVTEGDKVGDYEPGTVATAQYMMQTVENLLKLPKGSVSRKQYDKSVDDLNNYFVNAKMNTGFINLADYFTPERWVGKDIVVTDDSVRLNNTFEVKTVYDRESFEKNRVGGSTGLGAKAGSVIYCFDYYEKRDASNWMTIGLSQNNSMIQYNKGNPGYYLCFSVWTELQRATANGYGVIRATEQVPSGEKHSIIFGTINTNMGTYIVASIDGNEHLSMADVDNIVTVPLEFVMGNHVYGDYIELTESEYIPGEAEKTALWNKAYYELAKQIHKKYDSFYTNLVMLKGNGTKIVTADGVTDISDTPSVLVNDQVTAPYDKLAKAFGIAAVREGNSAVLRSGDRELRFTLGETTGTLNGAVTALSAPVTESNGKLMLPVQDVAAMLGKEAGYYDSKSKLLLIADSGDFPFQDQPTILARSIAMFDELATLDDRSDIKFAEIGNVFAKAAK